MRALCQRLRLPEHRGPNTIVERIANYFSCRSPNGISQANFPEIFASANFLELSLRCLAHDGYAAQAKSVCPGVIAVSTAGGERNVARFLCQCKGLPTVASAGAGKVLYLSFDDVFEF